LTRNFSDLIQNIILQFTICPDLDHFTLQGTFIANAPTDEIYLFLRPFYAENSDGHLLVHLPAESETHYWSFDPMGVERLSAEKSEHLGLPRVHFHVAVAGCRWEQATYDLIRKFHAAQSFDPGSQDVAIKLGYPLIDIDRLNDLIKADRVSSVIIMVQSLKITAVQDADGRGGKIGAK
jgi:hypothetical protein